MSSFGSLNTALTGILSARTGIDTASHNIANANTVGYTRQRVQQSARLPRATTDGFIGTGSQVDGIARSRDGFLDARVRTAERSLGETRQRSELLSRAEQVMAEPDQGITNVLGEVWASWEELGLDPPDTAARTHVLETLGNLTARVRSISQGWDQLQADATQDLGSLVDEVNATLDQVARLNAQIRDQSAGGHPPNDLLDQRDVLLDQLSEQVGSTATLLDDGTVRVSIGGLALVDADHVSPLSVDPLTHVLSHPSGATPVPGGELGGVMRVLDQDLPALRASLDQWVSDLTNALNAQHAAGESSAGVPGGPLLTFNPGNPAGTFEVAITDPALVAASAPPHAEFNGANAQAMAALRTNRTLALGGSETIDGGLRALVTGLAGSVAELSDAQRLHEDLVASSDLSRQAVHGVSIDEEMVQLLQYQHAYNAAARVMTAVDETLDTLINGTGRVGR